MMKFQYALNLGLATMLVVPAVTLGTGQNDSLEATLEKTVRALEELAGIEQRLLDKNPSAIHDVLRWSETPMSVPESRPQMRDELLVSLRTDVARLQRDAERLETGMPDVTPKTPDIPRDDMVDPAEGSNGGPTTVGLDDLARRKLATKPGVTPTNNGTNVASASTQSNTTLSSSAKNTSELPGVDKRNFEPEGYSADSFKLGRAYYRQGRYDLALASFDPNSKDGETMYWRARCLEKLGKHADAIAGYNRLIEMPDSGFAGERAKEDLEFLQWRLDFDKNRTTVGSKTP